MRVEVDARVTDVGLVARCWVVNDSAAEVDFDERCLVGPNVVPSTPALGFPFGVSVSATADPSRHHMRLLPGQIVGRERRFPAVRGHARVHAYVVTDPKVGLTPRGPANPADLIAAAAPFELGALD